MCLAVPAWAGEATSEGSAFPPLFIEVFPNPRNQAEATLQYRRERLVDVPVSATMLSTQELHDAAIGDTREVINTIPSLTYATDTGNERSANIAIRGIGTNVIGGGVDPGVAVYVDDVFIGRMAGFETDLIDVGRVEVLRGPQGTLYGKNAIGGAIKLHLVDPTADPTGEASVDAGSYNLHRYAATASGPMVPGKLAARLSLSYLDREGTVINRTVRQDVNSRENRAMRLQIKGDPNDDMELRFNLDQAEDRASRTVIAGYDDALRLVTDATDPYDSGRNNGGITAKMVWRRPGWDLSSVTALRQVQFTGEGSDFSANNQWYWGQKDLQRQLSQELRASSAGAGRLSWQGGLFVYGEEYRTTAFQELRSVAALFGKASGHTEVSRAEERQLSTAAFGEATWKPWERVSLTGGLRYTVERKNIDYRYWPNSGTAVLGVQQAVDTSRTFEHLSPKAVLALDVAPDVTAYAKVEQGYKSGGFNDLAVKSTKLDFDAETAWNYEVGMKSLLLDRRLDLNVAAFYLDWNNPQAQIASSTGTVTSNAHSATSWGGETELAWRPVRGLQLGGAVAFADAYFEDYTNHPTRDASGNRLPYASKMTYALSAEYGRYVTPWARAFGRVEEQYRTSLFFDTLNTLKQPGYGITNVSAGLDGENWALSAWIKNLFDQRYRIGAADYGAALGGPVACPGEPMTFGARLTARF